MRHLRQYQGETAEQWLARLREIDQDALPLHGRRTLALGIGYARYLIEKSHRELRLFPPAGNGGRMACAAVPGEWIRETCVPGCAVAPRAPQQGARS
jgi:hypothetical protein